eukprot:scaffold4815_cov363-Prasinococcus_capsulatus_cf.AAC.6
MVLRPTNGLAAALRPERSNRAYHARLERGLDGNVYCSGYPSLLDLSSHTCPPGCGTWMNPRRPCPHV